MVNVKESAPDSEEQKFKVKCQELRKRIAEVEESNEISTIALSRTRMSIRRLRLEYAVLLERLEAQVVRFSEEEVPENAESMARPYAPLLADDNLNFKLVKKTKAKKGRGPVSAAALRKAARDPNLPKRPTNAYLMFCDREKDRVRAELEKHNPGKPVTELTRVLTDMWKSLSEEAKIPYLKLYEEDRERYHREMVVYNKRKHDDVLTKKPLKIKLGVSHMEPEIHDEVAEHEMPETPSEMGDENEEHDEDDDDNGEDEEAEGSRRENDSFMEELPETEEDPAKRRKL